MKTLTKNIFRTFRRTWARFLSVSLLIGLAIFVFVGLFSAGPDMRQTVIRQFKKENLADVQVIASDKFTDADKKTLNHIHGIRAISYGKQTDAELADKGIHIISNPKNISTLKVIKGRLANSNDEIAIGEQFHKNIGEYITLKTNDLKIKKVKIVGIVRTSEFMSKTKLGQTNVADGTLSYFAVMPDSNFTISDNLARATFKNTKYKKAYTKNYSDTVSENIEKLERVTQKLTKKNQEQALADISKKEENLKMAEVTLKQKELQLKENEVQLNVTAQTATSYQAQLQIANQNAQLQQEKDKLKKLKTDLAQKKINLKKAKKQVSLLSITVQERSQFAHGYSDYGSSATRMDALALVLPVIFFAISLMVSFTTMRRMVTEKRIELGTLRALGFTRKEVMREYILYSTATAILGTFFGSLLGTFFLPSRIYNIFADGSYQLGNITFVYNIPLLLISLALSLVSTLFAAYWAARQELKEKPSSLMLAKPPAITNKIFLERLTFIWKKLSFSNKVTLRNAFRYKSRMFMTIFGVMGSISLLILGIGIRDSLIELVPSQYEHISAYDMIAVYNPSSSDVVSYQKIIKNDTNHELAIGYETFYAKSKELLDSQSIQAFTANNFKDYIKLDKEPTADGAILSQKLAHAFHLKVGDKLTVKNSEGKSYHIKVAGFTTNYVGHMIYMKPSYHEKVFHEKYENNAYLIRTKKNIENQNLAEKINKNKASLTIVKSKVLRQTISDFLNGLTNIILIIIFVSIMLAFIVLYTLTSINIAEREKELATIKVLGFYQKEALMYIFKETFLLTAIGILSGLALGYFIHKYVMTVIPPEYVMSIPGITWTNILISSGAVFFFTFIVMIIMNRHIRKIDMLEALKSVD